MVQTIKPMKPKYDEFSNSKMQLDKTCFGIYNTIVKRILGLYIAILLLIFLSPVMLIISLVIIIDSGFPILYKADRGGYLNKSFKIYKFRTMIKNADKIGGGTTALNDNRITKIGKFLRKTKLDELPQLINIVKGEMSFIGPRPELIKYTSQYEDIEKYILKVRPGLTDFSSIEFINLDEVVGGENADEMYEQFVLEKKNKLRIKYVKQLSFTVDIRLFFKTIFRTIDKSIKTIMNMEDKDGKNIS